MDGEVIVCWDVMGCSEEVAVASGGVPEDIC